MYVYHQRDVIEETAKQVIMVNQRVQVCIPTASRTSLHGGSFAYSAGDTIIGPPLLIPEGDFNRE